MDKQLRYEDAINALKGGIVEGVVPGGGACLAYMTKYADELREAIPDEEEQLAVDVIIKAMQVNFGRTECRPASHAQSVGRGGVVHLAVGPPSPSTPRAGADHAGCR